jgi:hypothetical protein
VLAVELDIRRCPEITLRLDPSWLAASRAEDSFEKIREQRAMWAGGGGLAESNDSKDSRLERAGGRHSVEVRYVQNDSDRGKASVCSRFRGSSFRIQGWQRWVRGMRIAVRVYLLQSCPPI